jgi:hypothetical protein
MMCPPLLRPAGAARHRGAAAGLGIGVGMTVPAAPRVPDCAARAHQRGIVLVVGRDADLMTLLSWPFWSFSQSTLPRNSMPSRSAKPLMRRAFCAAGCCRRVDAARRVQDRLDEGAAHVGPLRPFRAVQANQRPHLAPGELALQDDELAVQVHRAGVVVARGVAAGPALRGSSKPPGRMVMRTRTRCPWGSGRRKFARKRN